MKDNMNMSDSVESSVGTSQQAGNGSKAAAKSSVSLSEKLKHNLCIALSQCESEADLIKLLKAVGYWDDTQAWRHYGDVENNFSIINNQQSEPEASLVEKLTNSVDSMLIASCRLHGVDPEDTNAPQTMQEALASFLSVPEGKLACLAEKDLRKLADNIQLIATGGNDSPNYTIFDRGEGQTAETMPETLLSLSKSNKFRVPFVQGKFNMGGSGALRFCGENGLQVIITKRHPALAKNESDPTGNNWAFTVIRRFAPTGNERSSSYRYLAPNGHVMNFSADALRIVPSKGSAPVAYCDEAKHGTFIKLFDYRATPGNKSIVTTGMNYRLSTLLPELALPVRVVECRPYKGHTLDAKLQGLKTRVDSDRNGNIVSGYPTSSTIMVDGDQLDVSIVAFDKSAKMNRWRSKEGIIFTVNGQKQGGIDYRFFNRKAVNKSYLKDHLLLLVDCSAMKQVSHENLFMASRDRMRQGPLYNSIEKELEKLVKNHPGLRQLNEQYRQDKIKDNLNDSKPLADVLKDLIKKVPTLASLLGLGHRLNSPTKVHGSGAGPKFNGNKYPTFFTLVKPYSNSKPKACPINQRFRVQLKTDAVNDYFSRALDKGTVTVKLGGSLISEGVDFSAQLFDGTYTFHGELPQHAKVGSVYHYELEITDNTQLNPFKNDFYVKVEPAVNKTVTPSGPRRKPASKKSGQSNWNNTQLNIPKPNPVSRDQWASYGFDESTALTVRNSGNEGDSYDYFINVDNVHLLREQKFNSKVDPKVHFARYQVLMTLIGMSCIKIVEDQEKAGKTPTRSVEEMVEDTTRAVAAVILGVIDPLAGLDASMVASDDD